MKSLLIFVLLSPTVFMNTANNVSLENISRAIGNGDADGLGTYFDSSVEIAVLDDENVYSKTQAVNVVRGFFAENKPKSFSQVHKGASKGKDSEYCIGNLVTDSGNYRVYIYMKVAGDKKVIQEFHLTEQ